MNDFNDPLWPHFQPLWLNFRENGIESLLVAGGYGLFLKQNWLTSQAGAIQTVVPIENWLLAAPRVTKDVDLILDLELLGQEEHHELVLNGLEANGFVVGDKLSDRRWKFKKEVADEEHVILELHAPEPKDSDSNLSGTKTMVKHRPSLGEKGIHGRLNAEACGAELYPFSFEMAGTPLVVPNPITWSVMKLTAMRDRWSIATDEGEDDELREFARDQAIKHAQDAYRIVSMMTREESDTAPEIGEKLRKETVFIEAQSIWKEDLHSNGQIAETTQTLWNEGDISVIRDVMNGWFA